MLVDNELHVVMLSKTLFTTLLAKLQRDNEFKVRNTDEEWSTSSGFAVTKQQTKQSGMEAVRPFDIGRLAGWCLTTFITIHPC